MNGSKIKQDPKPETHNQPQLEKQIEELKRSERALRNSEDFFRTIADYTYNWELWISSDEQLLYVSPSCERITGYSPAEFIENPKLVYDIITPEDRGFVVDHHELMQEDNVDCDAIEYRIVTKTGETRWIEYSCQPVYSKDGRYSGRRGSIRDITQRKKNEEALRIRELYNRLLLEMSHELSNTNDLGSILDPVAKFVEKTVGYKSVWICEETDKKGSVQLVSGNGPIEVKIYEAMNFKIEGDPYLTELFRKKTIKIIEDTRVLPLSNEKFMAYFDSISLVHLPMTLSDTFYGVLGMGTFGDEEVLVPTEVQTEYLERAATHLIEAINRIRALNRQHKAEQEIRHRITQLRQLSQHIESATEKERTRLAREIHDELGQSISAMLFDLNWLKNQKTISDKYHAKIKDLIDLVGQTGNTIHQIVAELRPGMLDDLGLIPTLEWYIEEFKERTGIHTHLNFAVEDAGLKIDIALTLYRMFQEAMTNIAKHSQAQNVYINIQLDEDFTMEIRDDGIGILDSDVGKSGSFGLMGMRERIIPFGGELVITGQRNEGTIVLITIPIAKETQT